MKLLLQLCLLAAVCYQASAQGDPTDPPTEPPTEPPTTEAEETTTPAEETTTIFTCPVEKGKCKRTKKCGVGMGRCNKNNQCKGKLRCGYKNCQKFHPCAKKNDRCCEANPEICDGEPKDRNCCTKEKKCKLGGGNCTMNNQCRGKLICGKRNCRDFHPAAKPWANCCIEKS